MKYSALVLLASAIATCTAQAATLTVAVSNIKTEVGTLNIAIYNQPDDWLSDKVLTGATLVVEDEIKEGVITTTFDLEPGDYAISVHHDDNDNGKMDTNFIGIPKEPTGLSNGAVPKFGPPKYKDAVFTVSEDGAEMPIKLLD
jgi:uncharacterized protein (DUF2141 family)